MKGDEKPVTRFFYIWQSLRKWMNGKITLCSGHQILRISTKYKNEIEEVKIVDNYWVFVRLMNIPSHSPKIINIFNKYLPSFKIFGLFCTD